MEVEKHSGAAPVALCNGSQLLKRPVHTCTTGTEAVTHRAESTGVVESKSQAGNYDPAADDLVTGCSLWASERPHRGSGFNRTGPAGSPVAQRSLNQGSLGTIFLSESRSKRRTPPPRRLHLFAARRRARPRRTRILLFPWTKARKVCPAWLAAPPVRSHLQLHPSHQAGTVKLRVPRRQVQSQTLRTLRESRARHSAARLRHKVQAALQAACGVVADPRR